MDMKNNTQQSDISVMIKDFTVMYKDLDMTYSLSMPAICAYLFEVGSIHGKILTDDAELGSAFVLTRLYMKMERYPAVGDTFSVKSWLSPVRDRYVVRNFQISDSDGIIIGAAKTSAVAFNLKERTGGGIPANIMKVKTVDAEPATPHLFEKLHPVISPLYEKIFSVGYFDCDFYWHVNNVKYIEWCIETFPVEFIKSHRLYEIDANFRAEGNAGDNLVSKAAPGKEPGTFHHSITSFSGEKELLRMSSSWK